jgi:hypothetical protein
MIYSKTATDFVTELRHIESGSQSIESSKLYQFLNELHRQRIDGFGSLHEKTTYLKYIYDYDDIIISSFFLEEGRLSREWEEVVRDTKELCLKMSIAYRKQQWFILEKFYTLDEGFYDTISFLNLFITHKYHNYFDLPEFLITHVASKVRRNSNVNLIIKRAELSIGILTVPRNISICNLVMDVFTNNV